MTQNSSQPTNRDQRDQPINDRVTDLPPTSSQRSPDKDAVEAARTGRADQSVYLGANLPMDQRMASGRPTTMGDPDAMTEQAKVVGEEAVGGTTPTPDQDNVDDIAASAGINTKAEHPVRVNRDMQYRDENRFELDPESKGPASSA